eukprot:6370302-Prymnesium_polylepis.1
MRRARATAVSWLMVTPILIGGLVLTSASTSHMIFEITSASIDTSRMCTSTVAAVLFLCAVMQALHADGDTRSRRVARTLAMLLCAFFCAFVSPLLASAGRGVLLSAALPVAAANGASLTQSRPEKLEASATNLSEKLLPAQPPRGCEIARDALEMRSVSDAVYRGAKGRPVLAR